MPDSPKSTGPAFQAKQVVRPRQQVEMQLREAIMSGHFAQGDKLPPETELAERFGVSRPTVREALGALVASGLIRKVPGVSGGSFVNSVTPDSLGQMLSESVDTILRLGALHIGELTEVRKILEVPSARWAAVHRTDEHIAQLHSIIEKQRTTTIDDPLIPQYDFEFHTTVGQASGNRLIASFVAAVHGATQPVEFLDVTAEVGHNTVKQHMAIAAAIEKGDSAAAGKAMDKHLEYVLRNSTDYARHAVS